jgi:hypothetical protein
MATSLQSFARSPLGAFIRSPLDARDGAAEKLEIVAYAASADIEDGSVNLYVDFDVTASDPGDPPASAVVFALSAPPAHGTLVWQTATVKTAAGQYKRTLRYTPNPKAGATTQLQSDYDDPWAGTIFSGFTATNTATSKTSSATITVTTGFIWVQFAPVYPSQSIANWRLAYRHPTQDPPPVYSVLNGWRVSHYWSGTYFITDRSYYRTVLAPKFAFLAKAAAELRITYNGPGTGFTDPLDVDVYLSATDLGNLDVGDDGNLDYFLGSLNTNSMAIGQLGTLHLNPTSFPASGPLCLWLVEHRAALGWPKIGNGVHNFNPPVEILWVKCVGT